VSQKPIALKPLAAIAYPLTALRASLKPKEIFDAVVLWRFQKSLGNTKVIPWYYICTKDDLGLIRCDECFK
jgi:hypothetical protein